MSWSLWAWLLDTGFIGQRGCCAEQRYSAAAGVGGWRLMMGISSPRRTRPRGLGLGRDRAEQVGVASRSGSCYLDDPTYSAAERVLEHPPGPSTEETAFDAHGPR